MRVPCRPRQHGTGYAEIIVVPGRTLIENSTLTHLGFKTHQLLISLSTRRSINKADPIGVQLGVQKFEQIASPNGVDQHHASADWPLLSIHAVAMPTDMQPNHPRTKRFAQRLA